LEIILFYIPTASEEEAASLGHQAIDNHLAACANVFPVQSAFPWDGTMQSEEEFVLLLKTLPHLRDNLRSFIKANHSYTTPAVISWSADVNEDYMAWMKGVIEH
jgi:periplasmic divalent cation tolerance protein